ncbi:ABC transporter permease [Rossellomorea marisflavi]|uniref:ABC transporter permease n=1 Tax=Rossellomorea marisflavi TaxID=189381 RepID=UPI00345D659C
MLWQTSWRNLTRKKLRSFLTILAIVLGISSMFAVISTVQTAKQVTMQRLELYNGNADYSILSERDAFPEEVLDLVLKNEQVSSATGLIHKQSYVEMDSPEHSLDQKRMRLTGLSTLDNELLSLDAVSGDIHEEGLILPATSAEILGMKVGDEVTFRVPDGMKEIKVAAIVKDTPLLEGPNDWDDATNRNWRGIVPLSTLQQWYGLDQQIQEVRMHINDQYAMDPVVKDLHTALQPYDGVYLQKIVLDEKQSNQLEDLYFMLYVIGGLAMFISAFILYNTIFVSIVERKSEIAVMKTIGYTPFQIKKLFLFEVLILSVIGLIIGVPIGFGLGSVLQSGLFSSFQSNIDFSMDYQWALAASIVLGVAIPVVASLIPVTQASKIDIIKTLKKVPATNTNMSKWRSVAGGILILLSLLLTFVNNVLSIGSLLLGSVLFFPIMVKGITTLVLRSSLLGFEGKIAANNVLRALNRSSNMSLILALAICLGLFVSSTFTSLEKNIDKSVTQSFGGDMQITSEHSLSERDAGRMSATNGVKDVHLYKERNVTWVTEQQTRQFSIIRTDLEWNAEHPLFHSIDTESDKWKDRLKEGGILLGDFAYREWGGSPGENITIVIDNQEHELEVLGKVTTNQYGGYTAFMSGDPFDKLFPGVLSYKALLTLEDGYKEDSIKNSLVTSYPFDFSEVQTVDEEVNKQERALPGVKSLFNGLLFIAIVVSGIGIINTLVMNVMERLREVAIMRAVAFTSFQVYKTIFYEALIIGISGVLIGIVMGIFTIFLNAVTTSDELIGFTIPESTLLLSIIMGIIVSAFASLIPARQAVKHNINQALKQE